MSSPIEKKPAEPEDDEDEASPSEERDEVPAPAAPAKKKSAVETEKEAADRRTSNFKTIGGAIALAIFIRVVLFEAFMIDGPSMEPTLLNGDRVVVAKYAFGLFLPGMHEAVLNWGTPNRGDVVIVNSPMDDVDIVKRVIGIPGDRIEIRDDEVFVNGESIRERLLGPCNDSERMELFGDCELWEESLDEHTWRSSHDHEDYADMAEREVPPGHVFVLGDHRNRSNDSRRIGMIPVTRLKGHALAIYWSSDTEMRWDRMFSAIR
jgi:signal peptidase I